MNSESFIMQKRGDNVDKCVLPFPSYCFMCPLYPHQSNGEKEKANVEFKPAVLVVSSRWHLSSMIVD